MRRAFTLIELLVVIAIIAILAALLMPALESARDKARGVACIGQLRQLNIGFNLYQDHNAGWWPVGGTAIFTGGVWLANPTWSRIIAKELGLRFIHEQTGYDDLDPANQTQSYWDKVRNNGVFQCPAEHFKNAWGGRNSTSYTFNGGYGYRYCMGLFDTFGVWDADQYGRVHQRQILRPANTFVIGENYKEDGHWDYHHEHFMYREECAVYHSGGGNFLWCDGHAHNVQPSGLLLEHFDRR